MLYNIKILKEKEKEFSDFSKDHFINFFQSHSHCEAGKSIISLSIKSVEDTDMIYSGSGLYVILTNYMFAENTCKMQVNDLKAIYRGHAHAVKPRLISHLFNSHYRSNPPKSGTRYDVCLKLDGKNGIDIHEEPYNKFRWMVITYKMRGSSKAIREQAEKAFDAVYLRPIGSKES